MAQLVKMIILLFFSIFLQPTDLGSNLIVGT